MDRVTLKHAEGLVKNMKRYAKKVKQKERSIATEAKHATRQVIKAATVEPAVDATHAAQEAPETPSAQPPAQANHLTGRCGEHAGLIAREGPLESQLSARKCRPPHPSTTSSRRELERSL